MSKRYLSPGLAAADRISIPGEDHATTGRQHGSPAAVTLTLSGLPDSCPHCGEEPPDGLWVLRSYRSLLEVVCPWCHVSVAPVRAVAARPQHPGPPHGNNPLTGIAWNH